MRTNIFLELQFKIVCNRLKENRVSRLFLRDDSRASKKSKSTDFGFFLYLLAKIAVYWLFSQNIFSHLGCKTEYKCAWLYEGICKNFWLFGCIFGKTVLGYMEGYKIFPSDRHILKKTVLE